MSQKLFQATIGRKKNNHKLQAKCTLWYYAHTTCNMLHYYSLSSQSWSMHKHAIMQRQSHANMRQFSKYFSSRLLVKNDKTDEKSQENTTALRYIILLIIYIRKPPGLGTLVHTLTSRLNQKHLIVGEDKSNSGLKHSINGDQQV